MNPTEVQDENVLAEHHGEPAVTVPVASEPSTFGPAVPIYDSHGGFSRGSRGIQTTWLVVTVIEIFLILDFLFRALKANDVGFADLVYNIGGILGAPFDGIFSATITPRAYVIRWADILGIVIYLIVGWLTIRIIGISKTPRQGDHHH